VIGTKTQNRGNEAKKSLKTKELDFYKVRKRTQNKHDFEPQLHVFDAKRGRSANSWQAPSPYRPCPLFPLPREREEGEVS